MTEQHKVVTQIGPDDAVPDATALEELDPDVADAWDLWSVQIGKAVSTVFPHIQRELPGLRAAVMCTSDGLNLCSVGLEEKQVHRLAAFASSVFSMSGVAAGLVQSGSDEVSVLESITLLHGDQHTVLVAFRDLVIGSLLFSLTSTDALGVMLVQIRVVSEQIQKILGEPTQ